MKNNFGYYIGMDAGGTNLRIKISDKNDNILGEYNYNGSSINLLGYNNMFELYRSSILDSLEDNNLLIENCLGLCIGAVGVDSQYLSDKYLKIFMEIGFNASKIRIFNDCEILLHALDGQAGIVAVAGTGSITYGKAISGKIYRFGGWGHLVSDEGSAFFLVRRAFEEIIKYLDGYGSCEVLADTIMNKSNLKSQHEISSYILKNITNKKDVAVYAPLIDYSAKLGDITAKKIIDEATEGIYQGIKTIGSKVYPKDNSKLTVLLWGSVLVNNPYMFSLLKQKIDNDFPDCDVKYPDKSALDVALKISKTII